MGTHGSTSHSPVKFFFIDNICVASAVGLLQAQSCGDDFFVNYTPRPSESVFCLKRPGTKNELTFY